MHRVNLNNTQRLKLVNGFKTKSPVTLTLKHSDLDGPIPLLFTQTQLARINNAKKTGKGLRLTISPAQLNHMKKEGGGKIWDEIVHWLDGAANSVGHFVGNLFHHGAEGFQKGETGSGFNGGVGPAIQFPVGGSYNQLPVAGQTIHQSPYIRSVPKMYIPAGNRMRGRGKK